MKNLLYREFAFVIPKYVWAMLIFPAMLLIPQYPKIVGVGYSFLAMWIAVIAAKENRDLEFALCLPVTRAGYAGAKTLSLMSIQALSMLVAVPFAVVSNRVISASGNIVGLDCNVAFFGVAALAFTAANAVFFPGAAKSGYNRPGTMLLIGLGLFLIVYLAFEIIAATVPSSFFMFNSIDPADYGLQAAFAAPCLVLYVVSALALAKISGKIFAELR